MEHEALRVGSVDRALERDVRTVDGRRPEVRFSIWSVADLFLSLSDNVQETFGLTPVEAMAAGLPVVVSDWNGYRSNIRDGVDGFLVRTLGGPIATGQGMINRHLFAGLAYQACVMRVGATNSAGVQGCIAQLQAASMGGAPAGFPGSAFPGQAAVGFPGVPQQAPAAGALGSAAASAFSAMLGGR